VRHAALTVVTQGVSLFYGHEDFVADSAVLAVAYAVGTASRLRQVWRELYRQVRFFRDTKQRSDVRQQRRADLEQLVDSLANLESELSLVEYPLARIESYQSALYETMGLPDLAQSLSRMLAQLTGSLRLTSTAIDMREKRDARARRRWKATRNMVLTLVGVTTGFVIAFLSINTDLVNDAASMWSGRYAWVYFVAIFLAAWPIVLILWDLVRDRLTGRGNRWRRVSSWWQRYRRRR
jgi:hypothetical protein